MVKSGVHGKKTGRIWSDLVGLAAAWSGGVGGVEYWSGGVMGMVMVHGAWSGGVMAEWETFGRSMVSRHPAGSRRMTGRGAARGTNAERKKIFLYTEP